MSIKTLKLVVVLCVLSGLLFAATIVWSAKSEVKAQTVDSCKQYFDKAIKYAESAERYDFAAVRMTAEAMASVAYSKIYQNCRVMHLK